MLGVVSSLEDIMMGAAQAWTAFMRDFGSLYSPFRSAVQALAALDALQSLASLAVAPECVLPCKLLAPTDLTALHMRVSCRRLGMLGLTVTSSRWKRKY